MPAGVTLPGFRTIKSSEPDPLPPSPVIDSAITVNIRGNSYRLKEKLKAGDEVRFDTVRFLLMSPSQEAQAASAAVQHESAKAPAGSTALLWVGAGVAVLVGLALVALRYFGMI